MTQVETEGAATAAGITVGDRDVLPEDGVTHDFVQHRCRHQAPIRNRMQLPAQSRKDDDGAALRMALNARLGCV